MTEAELISAFVGSGGSVTVAGVVYYFLWKSNKVKDATQQILLNLLKADQNTREQNTKAITQLTGVISEFNRINGFNQKECNVIREAYTAETTRVNLAADRLEAIAHDLIKD